MQRVSHPHLRFLKVRPVAMKRLNLWTRFMEKIGKLPKVQGPKQA